MPNCGACLANSLKGGEPSVGRTRHACFFLRGELLAPERHQQTIPCPTLPDRKNLSKHGRLIHFILWKKLADQTKSCRKRGRQKLSHLLDTRFHFCAPGTILRPSQCPTRSSASPGGNLLSLVSREPAHFQPR